VCVCASSEIGSRSFTTQTRRFHRPARVPNDIDRCSRRFERKLYKRNTSARRARSSREKRGTRGVNNGDVRPRSADGRGQEESGGGRERETVRGLSGADVHWTETGGPVPANLSRRWILVSGCYGNITGRVQQFSSFRLTANYVRCLIITISARRVTMIYRVPRESVRHSRRSRNQSVRYGGRTTGRNRDGRPWELIKVEE